MSTQAELSKISVQDFTQRFRQEMIPLGNTFAYFSAVPLGEDEVKEFSPRSLSLPCPRAYGTRSPTFMYSWSRFSKGYRQARRSSHVRETGGEKPGLVRPVHVGHGRCVRIRD